MTKRRGCPTKIHVIGFTICPLIWANVLLLSELGLATTASDYRLQGLRLREQGRFPEAIAALQKSVDLEPENLSGRVTLGWTLHLANQGRQAAEILQANLQEQPFDVPTLNALGIVYLVNDDPVAAVFTHAKAALVKSDNEIAYYNLSLALQRLQHYDWAIATALKAIELEPDNPHPRVALAIAQWGQGKAAIAQATYRETINLDNRYQNLAHLEHLNQAGFSPAQIEETKAILESLLKG
ncbi:tetratricopeptide repeat protein [Oscillatoria sp. FACHB-1407]|uniref:tetratricopeptide repeat protein n=1 Tax=Oscillatoria sp. FACHB-1407 TaxID=2692847 RepID=UPI0016842073|nr:tetratricopeptide repeat protein [Oscillatoria sp. FACHB-1407]MBD2463856.1 tetratricopeptide repeat protein [Oscillatoria sp. FACHB-1407]